MISQNISSNPRPASRGVSSLLSAYEKATTENVVAHFILPLILQTVTKRPFS
jgi:hypothetical protein